MKNIFALSALITTLICQSAHASQQPDVNDLVAYYMGNLDLQAALNKLHGASDFSLNDRQELETCIPTDKNSNIKVGSVLHSNGQHEFYIGTITLNNRNIDEIIVTIRKRQR